MLDKAAPAHISARHRFGVGLTRWVADRRGCPQRWHDAVAELLTLQASYTGWLRALPATLQDTATGDVLQAIVDLDLDALGAGKRRLWPLTPPPTLSSWPTCRVTLTLSAAGECHFYFARLVTFLSCADTNAASGRDRSAVAAAIYRVGYLHAVSRFFAWCEHHQIGQLADIEPLHHMSPPRRVHSLFRQGCILYDLIPTLPDTRLRPLMERFCQMLRDQPLFADVFGPV